MCTNGPRRTCHVFQGNIFAKIAKLSIHRPPSSWNVEQVANSFHLGTNKEQNTKWTKILGNTYLVYIRAHKKRYQTITTRQHNSSIPAFTVSAIPVTSARETQKSSLLIRRAGANTNNKMLKNQIINLHRSTVPANPQGTSVV